MRPRSRLCPALAPRRTWLRLCARGDPRPARHLLRPPRPTPFQRCVPTAKEEKAEFLRCNCLCILGWRGGREGAGQGPGPRRQTPCAAPREGWRGQGRWLPRLALWGLECSRGRVYFVLGMGEGGAGAGLQDSRAPGTWQASRFGTSSHDTVLNKTVTHLKCRVMSPERFTITTFLYQFRYNQDNSECNKFC